ncbi:Uncharacterised protein [Bordetella pertussis]|nr:Uncharacterised protein [Bordetella pertussis]
MICVAAASKVSFQGGMPSGRPVATSMLNSTTAPAR